MPPPIRSASQSSASTVRYLSSREESQQTDDDDDDSDEPTYDDRLQDIFHPSSSYQGLNGDDNPTQDDDPWGRQQDAVVYDNGHLEALDARRRAEWEDKRFADGYEEEMRGIMGNHMLGEDGDHSRDVWGSADVHLVAGVSGSRGEDDEEEDEMGEFVDAKDEFVSASSS